MDIWHPVLPKIPKIFAGPLRTTKVCSSWRCGFYFFLSVQTFDLLAQWAAFLFPRKIGVSWRFCRSTGNRQWLELFALDFWGVFQGRELMMLSVKSSKIQAKPCSRQNHKLHAQIPLRCGFGALELKRNSQCLKKYEIVSFYYEVIHQSK